MSLVGSLEDLGLVDILQIVSLSRKSGVLSLRSECGLGQIVLRDGLVQGAAVKGDPERLRDLLLAARVASPEQIDRVEALARSEGLGVSAAALRICDLGDEQLDDLKREQVERAVMRMFGWRSGEFSFEIRDDFAPEDEELLLPAGLNTQYLAMEATRLGDEIEHAPQPRQAQAEPELVFSGEESDADDADFVVAEPLDEPLDESETESVATEPEPEPKPQPEAPDPPREARDLIVVDPDLSGLEWFKASVEPMFRRVHIFQGCGSAMDRVRQYLVRGIVPIVVIAEGCPGSDPEASRMVPRLRGLSASMPILCLRTDAARGDPPAEFDGVVTRPASPTREPDRWHLYEALAESLRGELDAWLRSSRSVEARRQARSSRSVEARRQARSSRSVEARRQARSALGSLKRVSERLRDPASQGEVLNVVLEFAAESFARVAVFMLRGDTLQGVTGVGLEAGGGPNEESLRSLEWARDELPDLFQGVLQSRGALRGVLSSPNDIALAARLGSGTPAEAYAAPIESSGEVVAIVYADNHPEGSPIRDTTAFEIVLHEAGMVLDRAVLERALASQGSGSSGD